MVYIFKNIFVLDNGYRQLDLSEETYVVEAMKEDVCFVAPNCGEVIKIGINNLNVDYILPNFDTVLYNCTI